MAVITQKDKAARILERCRECGVAMAILGTASHWNTEAILLAGARYGKKHGIRGLPVAVSMTYDYRHMPQCRRVTASSDPRIGFLSVMEHLRVLCAADDSPYAGVCVLPHLDHADPVRDEWALTRGLPYLASVMFDAQLYPIEQNIGMTRDYVRRYGGEALVEGILEQLKVEGAAAPSENVSDIAEKAGRYVRETGVDLVVADLGTEQQAATLKNCRFRDDLADAITQSVGKSMLVLHGTSSLSPDEFSSLGRHGIIRVNMWTRIARESGQYAARRLMERMDAVEAGVFDAADTMAYLRDATQEAARIMEDVYDRLGYGKLAGMNLLGD